MLETEKGQVIVIIGSSHMKKNQQYYKWTDEKGTWGSYADTQIFDANFGILKRDVTRHLKWQV